MHPRAKAPDPKEQRTGKGAARRDRVGATAPAGRNACYGHGSQVRHGLGEGGAGGEGKSARKGPKFALGAIFLRGALG